MSTPTSPAVLREGLSSGPFVIEGMVRTASGEPRRDGVVVAFAKALREEKQIAGAAPAEDGRYRISYDPAQLRIGEARTPLIVRYVLDDGTIAALSPLIREPRAVETIDLTTGGEYRGPSQHDALMTKLRPMLQGIAITSVRQDAQSREIGFLAGATGASRIDVKYLVLAHKLAEKSGVDPQVFFAFFKQAIPAGLAASLARERDAATIDD